MKHQEVIQTWFDKVWTEGRIETIHQMFPAEGEASGLGAHVLKGPKQFEAFHQALSSLLSNITISIDKGMESDEWFSALCTIKATQTSTGKKVSCTGCCYGRISDGQIKECANHWEFIDLFEQMGLFPKDCFVTALAGQQVSWIDSEAL